MTSLAIFSSFRLAVEIVAQIYGTSLAVSLDTVGKGQALRPSGRFSW
jgi:hypothetical protein